MASKVRTPFVQYIVNGDTQSGGSANHSLQFLGAKAAAALDKELMSSGAFSIDQLMELAGLSVSQAGTVPLTICFSEYQNLADQAHPVYRVQPPSSGRRVLVACGPGNNGVLLPVNE